MAPLNKYSLSNVKADYTPGVYDGFTLDFKPIDFSGLREALAATEARMYKASEKQTAVDMALADVESKLNPLEREWFNEYKNNIKQEIQAEIDAGNFGSAIKKANKLAGQVATDTRLINRIEYNKEYQQEKDKVLNDKTLSQTTKDRWLEENPYRYEDKYDANGNIVGGTIWTPNWRPYAQLDLSAFYNEAKKLAAVEAGGGESATFLDENGNLTNDVTKGFYGMAVKKGSKYERLSADKLKRIFDKLFAQTPGAKESIMQQMDDSIWEYNKLDDESKKAFIGSDIIKEDGTYRTPEEYIDHVVNPVLSDMAYNHVYSSIDYGSAYANRAKALKDKAAREELLGLTQNLNNTTFTTPIEIDYQEKAGRSYATVQTALKELNGLIPTYNTPTAENYIRTRNYEGLANYLETNNNLNGDDKRRAIAAINVLKNEGALYNKLIAPLSEEQRAAAEFVFAKESGANVPNAKDNKFSREYANAINNLFSYVKNPQISGSRTPISIIGVQFQNDSQKRKVLATIGVEEKDLEKYGLKINNIDGRQTLIIDKNSNKLSEVADAFNTIGNEFWSLHSTRLLKFDNNGNPITNLAYTGSNANAIYELGKIGSNNKALESASRITANAFSPNSDVRAVQTLQVQPFDDYNTQVLNELFLKGTIERADYNEFKKEFEANNLKALGAAVEHLSNYATYGQVDEKGNLVKLNTDQIEDARKEILAAYDEGRIEISPSDAPTGTGYGTIVRVKGKAGTKSKDAIESKIYYIDGLYDGPAAKAVANDLTLNARHNFQNDRALGIVQNDVVGNQINYNNPKQAIGQYQAKLELNNFYNVLDAAKLRNETFTEAEAKVMATRILNLSGYSEEEYEDEFKAARAAIVSKLLKYYED